MIEFLVEIQKQKGVQRYADIQYFSDGLWVE